MVFHKIKVQYEHDRAQSRLFRTFRTWKPVGGHFRTGKSLFQSVDCLFTLDSSDWTSGPVLCFGTVAPRYHQKKKSILVDTTMSPFRWIAIPQRQCRLVFSSTSSRRIRTPMKKLRGLRGFLTRSTTHFTVMRRL